MIKCENLSIGYDEPIVEPFNLEIKDNKWYGIIGRNGSGKTTFLKTILGVIKPLSGKLSSVTEKVGYIPQEREINLNDNWSGLTLVKVSYKAWKFGFPFYSKSLKNKAIKLLELVGASSYMHKPFMSLSGGQKKRIFLAQALINAPQILLLDEPLADLDPSSKQSFIKSLQHIRQSTDFGLTLLIISHDMHEIASYLDEFIHFKDAKVHSCEELPCISEGAYVGI
jgi:zinc/manganese transport system ATP-binding protein